MRHCRSRCKRRGRVAAGPGWPRGVPWNPDPRTELIAILAAGAALAGLGRRIDRLERRMGGFAVQARHAMRQTLKDQGASDPEVALMQAEYFGVPTRSSRSCSSFH